MKYFAISAVLIALLIYATKASASDSCDFDQAAVVKELISRAKANPGGVLDRKSHHVVWKEASGRTVRISHAGCMDLGSSVRVSFPERIDNHAAVAALILATSKYWSPIQANEMARIVNDGKFTVTHPTPDTTEFEADREASDAFPFGFTLDLQPTEASLSWQQL